MSVFQHIICAFSLFSVYRVCIETTQFDLKIHSSSFDSLVVNCNEGLSSSSSRESSGRCGRITNCFDVVVGACGGVGGLLRELWR